MEFDFETGFKVLVGLVLVGLLAGFLFVFLLQDESASWRVYFDSRLSKHDALADKFVCAAMNSWIETHVHLLSVRGMKLSLDGPVPDPDFNASDFSARQQRLAAAHGSLLELRSNLVFLTWLETVRDRNSGRFPWSDLSEVSAADLNTFLSRGMDEASARRVDPSRSSRVFQYLDGILLVAHAQHATVQQIGDFNETRASALERAFALDVGRAMQRGCRAFWEDTNVFERRLAFDESLGIGS